MQKIKKIIFDLETSINTKPSKWIFLLGGLFILSIIL
jgi:hypothetical protein|tara:strand:+ start:436 stop:546 length:111 start_codon:yes stop_codon:yes gene_type:complete